MSAPPPKSSRPPSGPLPRPLWFGVSLLVFLACSWVAFRQEPHPDAYRQSSLLTADWWLYPVEINAPRRLPLIQADLNDVFALKGTGHVWVVGGGGLILHSSDYGQHWERQYLVDSKDPAAANPVTFQPASPKRASVESEPAPRSWWHRVLPGHPLEGATLLGLIARGEPALGDDSAQKPVDDKSQAVAPPRVLTPNSGVSPDSPVQQKPVTTGATPTRRPDPRRQSAPPTVPSPAPAQEPAMTLRDLGNSDLYAIQFLDERNGWIGGANGALFNTENGGKTWKLTYTALGPVTHRAIYFDKSKEIWLLGDYGLISVKKEEVERSALVNFAAHSPRETDRSIVCHSIDNDVSGCLTKTGRGFYVPSYVAVRPDLIDLDFDPEFVLLQRPRLWYALTEEGGIVGSPEGAGHSGPKLPKLTAQALAVGFTDTSRGWIAGEKGLLIVTDDGGQTWHRATRREQAEGFHGIYPAPWYYLSLGLVGLLFVPALKRPQPQVISESAADLLVSDQPVGAPEGDKFDFSSVALGLSRFLRNEKTMAPLTIAVTGEWGTGKSSLMNLLRGDLARYGFRPVWFNAWHHQKEEHLLASLLEMVRSQAIPPWWRPEGAIFRLRLLKIRWSRFWPLIAFVLLVFSFSFGYLRAHPERLDGAWDSVASLADPLKWLQSESHAMATEQPDGERAPWIIFFLSSLGLLISVWKGLKGFGVNPASLLAKDSGRARVRDLENLTGFRHQFAAEFKDITQALNPRTMLVLIDDLDRCRPEMVLEVLEAVNFLVSSGDCFVVLGMARERVVRCVGLSFKDVASELLVTEAREDEKEMDRDDLARKRRLEFARQYLEKLINIEVPVPTPTDQQARRLFQANVTQEERPEDRRQRRWRRARTVAWKTLPAAVLVGLSVLGLWLGSSWPSPPKEDLALGKALIEEAVAFINAPTETAPGPSASKIPTGPAEMEAGQEASLPVPAVLVLTAMLVGLGIWRLSIPPGVVIRDSAEFEEALATWHPLIFSTRKTPRSIKRFLNRVRYLAMLQRSQSPEPTRWQQVLRWLRLGRAPEPATDGKAPAIPERALVALAAIDYCRADWLTFKVQDLPEDIRKNLEGIPLDTYRDAYSRMSKGIYLS